MNNNQTHTPKYWVAHNKTTDDVLLGTASKSKVLVYDKMREELGDDWEEGESGWLISLIEIRLV